MKQLSLCRMYHAACPHCLPPVAGSWGLTARGICRRPAAADCASRADMDGARTVDLGDMIIVAGFKSKELFRAGPGVLYDVLPAISADEWEILVSFCRDYTRRGVPWMVARNGKSYSLIKRQGAV